MVPRTGPHWPIRPRMTYEPARLDSEEWMLAVQVRRRLGGWRLVGAFVSEKGSWWHVKWLDWRGGELEQAYLTQTKMLMAMKIPRYRPATLVQVPSRMYPIAAKRLKKVTKGPRMPTLSVVQAVIKMTKKQSRYGGAVRPCDWTVVNSPISEIIVGTNSGREAKPTLTEKYMMAGM